MSSTSTEIPSWVFKAFVAIQSIVGVIATWVATEMSSMHAEQVKTNQQVAVLAVQIEAANKMDDKLETLRTQVNTSGLRLARVEGIILGEGTAEPK